MKLTLRREIFHVDTFTALTLRVRFHRIEWSCERPRKERDRAFHWTIGR